MITLVHRTYKASQFISFHPRKKTFQYFVVIGICCPTKMANDGILKHTHDSDSILYIQMRKCILEDQKRESLFLLYILVCSANILCIYKKALHRVSTGRPLWMV